MANYSLTWSRLVRNICLRLKRSLMFTLFLVIILSFTLSVFALVNQNHVQFSGIKNYLRGARGGEGPLEVVQMKKIHELKWSTNRPKHRKMVQFYPDNQLQRHENIDQGSWQDGDTSSFQSINSHLSQKAEENVSVSQGVHIFYYAWYGNPKHDDGKWYHWNHEYLPNWDKTDGRVFPRGRHCPEENDDIGSNFYPELGPYSSRDPVLIRAHFKMIRDAHIGVIALSWYPPAMSDPNGPPVDKLVPLLLEIAAIYDLKIAFHIEPYEDRNPQNVKENVKYIIDKYGSHHAFYRRRGKPMFYIYDSYLSPSKDWYKMISNVRGTKYDGYFIALLVEFKHRFSIKEAGFDGFYTYFGSNHFSYGSTWKNWRSLQSYARKHNLLFIPSLSPGYIDTRVRPWNTPATRSRRKGAYYDLNWRTFEELNLKVVSVTSFNEWHEGTQIEPAKGGGKSTIDLNFTYLSYGPFSSDFYLLKTKDWIEKLFLSADTPKDDTAQRRTTDLF